MRRARIRALIGPSVRTIRWIPLVAIVPLGVAIVRAGTHEGGDPTSVALPIATALLGMWLCLVFEDPAEAITAPTPTPLALRRAIRATIAILPLSGVWFAYTWIGPLDGPTAAMTTWFAAVLVGSLAAAAVAARVVPSARSGMLAAASMATTLFGLPIVLAVATDRPVAIDPARLPITAPVAYWTALFAGAVAVLAVAHRDPARGWRR